MKPVVHKRLEILSGSSHPELSKKVAAKLGVKLCPIQLEHFANKEIRCQINGSVRGADLFIIQTHNPSPNDAIMEQAIIIDAAKRASARHITAVCPFFGYGRQDRKATGREPITAKLVVDILATAGADRIVGIDLHTGQIQGFFNGPFDHLTALPALARYLKKQLKPNSVIVSPDAGRVKLAEGYASFLGTDLAIIHKRRSHQGVEALHLVGEIDERNCILIDDMIDTAGTICAAAQMLKKNGAKSIRVVATHGMFSPPAESRFADSSIDEIVVSDTISPSLKNIKPKIKIVSIAGLLASAIEAIFEEESVSAIFDGKNQM